MALNLFIILTTRGYFIHWIWCYYKYYGIFVLIGSVHFGNAWIILVLLMKHATIYESYQAVSWSPFERNTKKHCLALLCSCMGCVCVCARVCSVCTQNHIQSFCLRLKEPTAIYLTYNATAKLFVPARYCFSVTGGVLGLTWSGDVFICEFIHESLPSGHCLLPWWGLSKCLA